jgi:hypothetical protein
MTMKVINLSKRNYHNGFYSNEFRNLIENHLQILKNTSKVTSSTPIDGIKEIKYRGDFNGLLMSIDIPIHLHWVTMRMNDLAGPTDYQGNLDIILIPDVNYIDFLYRRFLNSGKYIM